MNRKERHKTRTDDNPDSEWSYRCIGAFCGGLLGISGFVLITLLIGDVGAPIVLSLLAVGFVVGCTLGYRFPGLADGALWVIHLFT